MPLSLRRLFPLASFVGCGDIRVNEISADSRNTGPGELFAVTPGTLHHGREFLADALARGVSGLLVEEPVADCSLPQCVVPNVRLAYAEVCAALVGHPDRSLTLAGVTGTNGKTTTTWLLRSIQRAAANRCGLLGTIEYHDGEQSVPASLTTPDCRTFLNWLAAMRCSGTTHAALEVSSHAIDQERTAGVRFDVAVITNITHDHLDYHHTLDEYAATKFRIAERLKPNGTLVLNLDDPRIRERFAAGGFGVNVTTYGSDVSAENRVEILSRSLSGMRLRFTLAGYAPFEATTRLIGDHNASNCLAAAVTALATGCTPENVVHGLRTSGTVPGRLEPVDQGQPFSVFIDYAHTPDALARAIATVRELTDGQITCVVGAGGDRDRSKRRPLGEAASTADRVVLTSDNPRSEDPLAIIHDVRSGVRGNCHIEPDRGSAIAHALRQAGPTDCVLIAGKGHERYQNIGGEKLPFDDRMTARDELELLLRPTGVRVG